MNQIYVLKYQPAPCFGFEYLFFSTLDQAQNKLMEWELDGLSTHNDTILSVNYSTAHGLSEALNKILQ